MRAASTYLPVNLAGLPLFQNTSELIDYIVAKYEPEIEILSKKYNAFYDIDDIAAVKATIDEQGFGYLLDILELSVEEYRTILAYIPVIHYLKGTRQGLDLIFTLLGTSFELMEWWEKEIPGEPLTADITIYTDASQLIPSTWYQLRAMLRQYVYAKLIFILVYNFEIRSHFAVGGFQIKTYYGSVEIPA